MKYRTVVISVPVVSLPSLAQVWRFAWRLLILFSVIFAGYACAAIWPAHELIAMFIAGSIFARLYT